MICIDYSSKIVYWNTKIKTSRDIWVEYLVLNRFGGFRFYIIYFQKSFVHYPRQNIRGSILL